jgi:hypothetical protein
MRLFRALDGMDFEIPANMKFCSRSSIARLAAGRSRRAWLVLLALAGPAEGSVVKPGANAELQLRVLKPASAPGGVFEGLLNVVKGAFRFTTTLLSKAHRRRLDVRIANALGFRSAWIVRQ